MNKRIKVISSNIKDSDIVLDIGCDQALLSELLAKRKIRSYACDIRKNIVKNASKRLEQYKNYITFIVSDGLNNVNYEDINVLVLSGMGTYTILNILNKPNKIYKKVITISNNNHDILRKSMNILGYKVEFEEIICDKLKYYNLIIFIPGNYSYTELELLIGLNHKNTKLLNEKLKLELKKYTEIFKLSSNSNIGEKITLIKEYLLKKS